MYDAMDALRQARPGLPGGEGEGGPAMRLHQLMLRLDRDRRDVVFYLSLPWWLMGMEGKP